MDQVRQFQHNFESDIFIASHISTHPRKLFSNFNIIDPFHYNIVKPHFFAENYFRHAQKKKKTDERTMECKECKKALF